MPKIYVNNGLRVVEASDSHSLLSALTAAGILVPSACGGRAKCGYCRLKIHDGNNQVTGPEIHHLSQDEQDKGFRLACQFVVTHDIGVTIPASYFSARKYRAKVVEKKALTSDTALLRMQCVEPSEIEFKAGQYVQLRSNFYQGHAPVFRAYSIASAPSERNVIDLIVKKVDKGICSTWVVDLLQVDSEVVFNGPFGSMLISDTTLPMLLIAGASGVAPLLSMLLTCKEMKIDRKIILFFGVRTQADLYLVDQLTSLGDDLPNFSFIPALSHEPSHSGWKGERGLITEVIDRVLPTCEGYEAYICGSPAMTTACLSLLCSMKMEPGNIFYDAVL